MSSKAMKVSHKIRKTTKYMNSQEENFSNYLTAYGDKRLINRLLCGRSVKPCGKECRDYGIMIARHNNHSSFKNFSELMNDREFVLEIAKITPNPTECDNYFYMYVNKFLKKSADFRLEFLKAIYFNENVYKLEDINLIVERCGFEKENEILLNDIEFKNAFDARIAAIDYQDRIEYHCSGEDEKELHDYKVKANCLKVLCDNMVKGLTEISKSFKVGQKEEDAEDFFYVTSYNPDYR